MVLKTKRPTLAKTAPGWGTFKLLLMCRPSGARVRCYANNCAKPKVSGITIKSPAIPDHAYLRACLFSVTSEKENVLEMLG